MPVSEPQDMSKGPTLDTSLAGTDGLRQLHPAYFSVVMATGIVSLAAHWTGFLWIARALFFLNLVIYPILVTLYAIRARRYPREMLADLCSHARGVGFFTIVAGTCVLGSQFVVLERNRTIGLALWIAGVLFWILLSYGVLALLTVRPEKPPLTEGLNGGWLVAVVAAQAVSTLGSQLADGFDSAREPLLFFCLVMWLAGGMLYVWMIALVFYRYTFFPMSPSDLTPPYWINMGAAAISTLAGAQLVVQSPENPVLTGILPFVKGITIAFWATATWWFPMLIVLGYWRHIYSRFPLRYDPLYWGAVFPLGMYTVCTHRLADVIRAPFLDAIPKYFVYVAFTAWSLTFLGLSKQLIRTLRDRRAARQEG